MRCPFCSSSELKVIDKRVSDNESNRRRRECLKCGKRFTTYERVEMIEIKVVKKDGRREPFNRDKILKGLLKACEKRPIGEEIIQATLDDIESEILNSETQEIKSTEIGDIVMKHLKKVDEIAYIRFASVYREFKDLSQFENELSNLKVVNLDRQEKHTENVADINLFVSTPTKDMIAEWDRSRIIDALEKEIKLIHGDAEDIAKAVELKVLRSGVKSISTSFLRELVNNELFERGMTKKLEKQEILGISVYNLNQIIFSKVEETGMNNNPETVNMSIAQQVLKNYALKEVFSKDVAEAHLKGAIHIHDLGYITKLYSAIYSLEYIKKYGLKLLNLNTESFPAKHAETLTGHLNTFLAGMQAYYSGSIRIEYLNIFYAPMLLGKNAEELKQEAQRLIFGCNQNVSLRGGQSLFIDFDIYLTVPKYLENTPAIGQSGKYILRKKDGTLDYFDKIKEEYLNSDGELKILSQSSNNESERFLTYKDFEKEAQEFAKVLIKVWEEGDANKKPFIFPRMYLHLSKDNSDEEELINYACKVAQTNAAPYFLFERDNVCYSSTEKKQNSNMQNTMTNPEYLHAFGLQNVILNLPRCAYKGKTIEDTITEIKKIINIAIKAHLQKKAFITKISSIQSSPLLQLEMNSEDEQKYANLTKVNYIIGTVGLNECVRYIMGKEMHESEDAYKTGLKIISAIYLILKELEKAYNVNIILEQEFSDSPAHRIAKIDYEEYLESKQVINIDKKNGEPYYTDSINLSDNSDVQIFDRIEKQGKFDPIIESRTITKLKLGKLKQEEIYSIVKKAFENTQVKCVKFEK